MKLDQLYEHRPAYLFHVTPIWNLIDILLTNSLDKGQHWGGHFEPDGIRLTRSYKPRLYFLQKMVAIRVVC